MDNRRVIVLVVFLAFGALALLGVVVWTLGTVGRKAVKIDPALVMSDRAEHDWVEPIADFDFAVVSDLQFGRGDDERSDDLLGALPKIAGLPTGGPPLTRPAFVLTCGDNTAAGDAEAYARFKGAMDTTGLTFHYGVGDRDARSAASRGLRTEPYTGGRTYYMIRHNGVRIIVLSYYGEARGRLARLGEEQREWLRARLIEVGLDRPIVIVLHPLPERWKGMPLPPGMAMGVDEATFLASTIQGFNVACILCGHHQEQHSRLWYGVRVVCVGSWRSGKRCVVAGHVRDEKLSLYGYTAEAIRAAGKEPGEGPVDPSGKLLLEPRSLRRTE